MDIKLTGGAGFYEGSHLGRPLQVANQEAVYGDKGWLAWVGYSRKGSLMLDQVTDYPRRTRAEALAVAVATINAEAR